MRIDNPLELVRQLKGAPLSVYIACQIVRQVVSQNWICEQTGYTDHAVTRALSYLTGHNYLSRVTGGWMIASGAIQLPLMAALPDEHEAASDLIENDFQKNRDNRDSSAPIIIIDSPLINESLTNNNNKDKNRDYRDSQIQDLGAESNSEALSSIDSACQRIPAELEALKAALKAHTIVGKKHDELVACEWVTVEYVHASVDFAKAEGREQYAIGIAITRMLAHVDQPARRENGHIENCNCAKCKSWDARAKYGLPQYDEDDEEEEDGE